MRLLLLASLFAAASALAQTVPPRSAPLPNPDALPAMPSDTRLPGPDPRQCGPTKHNALCAEGRWTQFSRLELRVSAPRFSAHYNMEQTASGETHTTYRERVGDLDRAGEIVIFTPEAFAYRSRDKFPDPTAIIDYAVSSPIMMAELASLLLDLGVLGPPSDVTAPRAVSARNQTQYIRTAAPRLAAVYGPPWSMTGTVRPGAKPQDVAFSLRLRYRPVDARGAPQSGKTDTVTLEGTASYAPKRDRLPDTLDLVGWKVMKADALQGPAATLAEARSLVGP